MPRVADVPNKIERKGQVPDDLKTDEKDRAADWLDENILRPGKWDEMTLTEIAEISDWSRQHIKNVVRDYYSDATQFEEEQGTDIEAVYVGNPPRKKEIPVPNDVVDKESYIRGYLAAKQ